MSAVWVVSGLIGWLSVLPSVAGTIVSLVYFNRSRWGLMLLAGFSLQAASSIVERAAVLFMGRVIPAAATNMGLVLAVCGGLLLIANSAIVCGIAGLLYDLGSRERPGRTAA